MRERPKNKLALIQALAVRSDQAPLLSTLRDRELLSECFGQNCEEGKEGVDLNMQWFQQDDATAHTANQTLQWLQQRFNDRIISRRTVTGKNVHEKNVH